MKKIFLQLFSVLLLLLSVHVSQGQTIFDYRSAWKYLDNGSNQGTAWTGTGFNDAAWVSDTGWFGYGDPSFVTKCVNACGTVSCSPSCGSKYITTYFRKVVNIPNIAAYDSMILNIIRDDGFVVYVNGVEVWRNNLPTGTISHTTVAQTALGGADEYTPITLTIPRSFFVSGNNTIAVELHQQAGSSSDLNFNMQMVGVPSPILFDYRSAWKYLDNGSNQGTAWRGTGFSDASWASDTGWFGYGDPTFVTKCVNACGTVSCSPSCGSKYITTYFRKVVNIPSVAPYDSVILNIMRDDGFVAYVNGVEVWRNNMPSGTISHTTTAPSAIGGADEYTPLTLTIPISFFVSGDNTIAIELHQQSGTSSDLNFNMRMEAKKREYVPPVLLIQGPYLQMGNQTAVSVRWRTNIPSKSRAMFGTTLGTYPILVSDNALATEHELRVTGLMPNTKYFYSFGTDTSVIQGDSTHFFTTAPADTSTRRVTLAAFGDCGRNDNSFQTGSLSAYQNFLSAQGMKAADIMMLVGDNAYNSGTQTEFTNSFFNRYSPNILRNHILFPAPGNHDYYASGTGQADKNVPYYSLFTMPASGECGGVPSGTEAYYSYDWGNVHILSLDSYGLEDGGSTRLYDTSGAQVTWIKNDLAMNTKKWVIVYFHHPPYTKGSHNSDSEGELINMRQRLIQILERYGVDIVLCGHSHDYERSYLLKGHYGNEASFNKAAHTTDSSSARYNGTTNSCPYTYPSGKINHGTVYVVSGSAGADGGVQSGYPHDALPFSIDDGGMFFMDIKDNRLDAKFIRRNNTIGDQFTIMKDVKKKDTVAVFPGTPVSYTASWPGTYAWNTGATTRSNTVIVPLTDTMITVKDNNTGTCLTDQHFIDVQCTMPVFTTCPSDIVTSGCNAIVNYIVADTATPNPTLSYSFTGATTGSGSGTGSGSTFNIGVTNVTITATNICGSVNCSINVTVNPLPNAVTVTGGGVVCGSTIAAASNGSSGTIYYQGTNSGGISTAVASMSETINATGIYYFRAQGTDGCWGPEGSITVSVNPLPSPVVALGGGTYCGNATLLAGNGGSGIIYYQGTTSGGTSITTPTTSQVVTTTGNHYFRAQSSAGCWSNEGSVAVTVNPLPVTFTLTGGGSYCAGGTGVNIGLSGSTAGIAYQLYNGISSIGSAMTGTGSPINFGMQTGAGVYTVIATNPSTLCNNTFGVAPVSINPLPAIYTITGGGSYCAGGTGVNVGLSGSATGISYQLFKDGVPVGTAVAGTGSALSFGLQTAAGSYSVIATNATTYCQSNMTGSVSVIVNPLPIVYTVVGGGHYCAGGTGVHIGLSASNGGINYQLYNGLAAVGSPMSGVGGSLDYGLITSAGSHTIVATNPLTGCTNNMSGSASVFVDPLPVVHSVTGGGSYCAGGTGLNVNLGGSEAGINYQLYNGSSMAGSAVAGSGSMIGFGLQTSAGTYTVLATNPATGCSNTMSGSAVVVVNALPATYTVTGGGNYCASGPGMHVGLSGSQTGIRYRAYLGSATSGAPVLGSGAAIDFGFRTLAGTYSVIATDTATGCTRNMTGAVVVSITPLVFPSVGISSDKGTTVCEGQLVTYTALPVNGGTAPVYKWLVNSVPTSVASATYNLVPKQGDVVSVSMTSNATCVSSVIPSSSLVMTVDTLISPSVSLIANPGTHIFTGQNVTFNATVMNAGPAVSYKWMLNGATIPGATTFSYSSSGLSNNDTVTCMIATGNGCGNHELSKTLVVHISNVGVNGVSGAEGISISPNPNNGKFSISGRWPGADNKLISAIVTNLLGQVVHSDKISLKSGEMNQEMQLPYALPNGMYTVTLSTGAESKVFQVVVER